LTLNLAHFGSLRRLPKVTVSAEVRRELDESTGFLRAGLFLLLNGEIAAASPDAGKDISVAIDGNKTGTFVSEMLYVDNQRNGRAQPASERIGSARNSEASGEQRWQEA
jgi:hypothetical protein